MVTRAIRQFRRFSAVAVLLTAALGFVALASPAAHADASVTRTKNSVDVINFPAAVSSCVNGGSGEVIRFNGTLHRFQVVRTDAQGGLHVTVHVNLADMSGIGLTTGDTYRVTDTAGTFGHRLNLYFPPGSAFPHTVTENADLRYISAGSGDNLLIRSSIHLTIDANGDVVVSNPTFEQVCVG